jgi:hypothetical protein
MGLGSKMEMEQAGNLGHLPQALRNILGESFPTTCDHTVKASLTSSSVARHISRTQELRTCALNAQISDGTIISDAARHADTGTTRYSRSILIPRQFRPFTADR